MMADDGIAVYVVHGWAEFATLVRDEMFRRDWVYRGQADASWPLVPSLIRFMVRSPYANSRVNRRIHLGTFRRGTIAHRGAQAPDLDDETWWGIGQHFGLATPYLDWTFSPYVAAYFALVESFREPDCQETRVVWALNRPEVERASSLIWDAWPNDSKERPPIVEFVRPLSPENRRLINQQGIFTRSPIRRDRHDNDIMEWVRGAFRGESAPRLVKIEVHVDESLRREGLLDLNRMNVNPLSLFPDTLEGAARYANLALEIEDYDPES